MSFKPLCVNIDEWIENVNKRMDKYPEAKIILTFKKYVLYKLYNYAIILRSETHELFTQFYVARKRAVI